MKLKEGLQPWLASSISDPIAKILAKNSHLTTTQLETLLIDILAEHLAGKQLKYDEKARLRQTKARITRGSFNRTARQAKDNVAKSIYTILLLGYLGIFESTSMDSYLELSHKLRDYSEACKDLTNKSEGTEEHLKLIGIIREELENSLKQLAQPSEGTS